jgi:hypothetical protein
MASPTIDCHPVIKYYWTGTIGLAANGEVAFLNESGPVRVQELRIYKQSLVKDLWRHGGIKF